MLLNFMYFINEIWVYLYNRQLLIQLIFCYYVTNLKTKVMTICLILHYYMPQDKIVGVLVLI